MTLYIKNMVCDRCIMVVREQLDEAGLQYRNIQLGEVELDSPPTQDQVEHLSVKLASLGFEILDDQRSALVNQIKSTIIRLIHNRGNEELNKKMSVLLSEKLGRDYHFLSTLFSSIEGVTIEKFLILQRIERVKELLVYDEMTLNEIAYELGYSSVQHLSQQFRKVTGMTPSEFRQLKENRRKPLDQV
ncbi:MAG TPA: AraC family transcriptional regulator [Flavisolibacter sp.]